MTRRGTIAPSDRQSKLRKSIYHKNELINHNSSSNNTSGTTDNSNSNQPVHRNSIYYVNSPISTSSPNEKRTTTVFFRFQEERNTTDKALPLTVACHFKVRGLLIIKINALEMIS